MLSNPAADVGAAASADTAEAEPNARGSTAARSTNEEDAIKRENRSRKLLASTGVTPEWLRNRFPVPSDVTVSHVVHRSSTLPHFQMRFHNNEACDGKRLV